MTICIAIIAAVAENNIIGNGNTMPWKIKSELKYFKTITQNKPVIMGRKTFESIGKPLKDRSNIVVTRDASYSFEGVIVVNSFEEAVETARKIAIDTKQEEIIIAGGAEVYAQAMPIANRIYMTRVHYNPKGDAKFPEFNKREWHEVKSEFHQAREDETADYSVRIFDRIDS